MNKKQIKKAINNLLDENDSIDKKYRFIEKLEEVLLKIREKISNNMLCCENCGKYFYKRNTFEKVETDKNVTTFTDAGYGDDDRIGDIKYLKTFCKCPYCKKNVEVSKQLLEITNERMAYE